MSLSITACLNLSQARPSLLRKVIRPLSGDLVGEGLDRFAPRRGRESSTLEIGGLAVRSAGSRTTIEVVDGVKESTFCFLLNRRFGRLPVSNFLDTIFLFFDKAGGTSFNVNKVGG